MTWPIGGRRQSNEQREEIIAVYLSDPEAAQRLAMSRGLSAEYAYKLVNARGLLPRKGEE